MNAPGSLLVLLAALLAGPGCSPSEAPQARPGDFTVEYFFERTLPPPRDYTYTITVVPTGEGRLVRLDVSVEPPKEEWSGRFVVDARQMDSLYRTMVDSGVFTRRWREDTPYEGGSYQKLTVVAAGRTVIVGSYLAAEERKAADAVYDAVRALVPKALWAELDSVRGK
jgi:hypothetical protein